MTEKKSALDEARVREIVRDEVGALARERLEAQRDAWRELAEALAVGLKSHGYDTDHERGGPGLGGGSVPLERITTAEERLRENGQQPPAWRWADMRQKR